MRNLERNKSLIKYLNYVGITEVVDREGHLTGEQSVTYTNVKSIHAHISGARGSSIIEVFGTDISYDKTILLTKSEFDRSEIDENSVFFINVKPKYNKGIPLYDYRVKRIAETINEVLIAIEKVSN